MTSLLLFAALVAVPAGDYPRPDDGPTGLSGIAHVSNDVYYAVNDSGSFLVSLTVGVDRVSGEITGCGFTGTVALEASGRLADLEGVAWDAATGLVWASDEFDASVRAFDPATGARRGAVALPSVQDAFRYNRSIEALALSHDGRTMWCCNEEALDIADARRVRNGLKSPKPLPGTHAADGPRSSSSSGTRVRLMRFGRDAPGADWRQTGEWAYETDPLGGMAFMRKATCGVAALAVLGDGTLLAMERELSLKMGKVVPSLRCRIYAVDVSGADDVSALAELKDFSGRAAAKTLVWGADTGFTNYEGLCEGPRLKDGSRTLVLISDADGGMPARVKTLVLRRE